MSRTKQFPPLEALDRKMLDAFPNKVVRKSYAQEILAFKNIPQYIAEYLINQHQDPEGMLPDDAITEIANTIEKYYPDSREKEKWMSLLMTLKKIQVIDHYEVHTDLNKKRYLTHIPSLNESSTVDEFLVQPKKYPELLCGGIWGLATFEYIQTGDRAKVNMCDFESFQARGAYLGRYIEKRKQFTTEEWLNFLIKTIGLDPNQFDRRQKFLYLSRLIPMVEPNTNYMELGPPGTGKSYIYENLSFYSRLVLGGEVTLATLIYNMNSRENGLIFKHDVVCFDEINKMAKHKQELVSKLQQIMASGHVERGDLDSITNVSFVFQGNILTKEVNGEATPASSNHFIDLPPEMTDSPFLDRIHAYIHGWEFRQIEVIQINRNLGLIANYFAELLHKLRRQNFYLEIDRKLKLYSEDLEGNVRGISLRDKNAVYHNISGFLKLIYPHKELTDVEWSEITNLAIELRQNVLDEIRKKEPNLFSRKLKFQFNTQSAQYSPPAVESQPTAAFQEAGMPDDSVVPVSKQLPLAETDPLTITVHITHENLLTKSLPYWIAKPLIIDNHLKYNKAGYCQVSDLESTELLLIKDANDAVPLSSDNNTNNSLTELEQRLPEVQKNIEKLYLTLENYHSEICQLKIIQSKLEMINNDQFVGRLEETKKTFFGESEIDKLKQDRRHISLHKEYLMKSRKEYVDLNNYVNLPIFTNIEDFNKLIREKDEFWRGRFEQFKLKFQESIQQAKNLLPQERAPRNELFNGAKFKLFAFDMNNLIVSFRKKYLGHNPIDLFNKLKSQVLPIASPYKAFYYASKHLENYQFHTKDLPDEYNQWRIETHRKWDGTYVDVDQNLTGEICAFIVIYHDKITEFHLGSGDKDLHIVCEHAQRYKIPIFIHVIDEKTLSDELASFANDIQIMFN